MGARDAPRGRRRQGLVSAGAGGLDAGMRADPLTAAEEALGAHLTGRPKIVSDRGQGALRRITARAEGPGGPLALRIVPEMEAERWRRMETGARAMHAALKERAHDHTPRVVASDEGTRAILSEWAPGTTLLDAMHAARGDAALVELVEKAARWTGALHAATALGDRPVGTRAPVGWVRRIRERSDPVEPEALDRALAMLAEEAASLDGQVGPYSVHHGDLHAMNLIVDGEDVTGIDPELPEEAPNARDLAYLLTDVAVRMAPRLERGAILPERMMARAMAAYGMDPGPLGFFCRVRLLRFWADVPADPNARTLRREHVWQGIKRRRGGLFPGL